MQFLRMVIHPRIYEYVRYSVSLTISLMCFTESNDEVLNGKLRLVLDFQFASLKTLILIRESIRSCLSRSVSTKKWSRQVAPVDRAIRLRGRLQPRPRLSHTYAIISASPLFIIALYCFQVHYVVRYTSSINLVAIEQHHIRLSGTGHSISWDLMDSLVAR